MLTRMPAFYPQFACKGSACTDNCCIGWGIDIDEKTAAYYAAVPGTFGKRLHNAVYTDDDGTHFCMQNGRCPMLNAQNLCDVLLTLGEEHLSEICTQHPRFYTWIDDITEVGLGLCCEEAARLLFLDEKPLRFITAGQGKPQPPQTQLLFAARETAYTLVQNRENDMPMRLALLTLFGTELQQAMQKNDLQAVQEIILDYSDEQICNEQAQQLAQLQYPAHKHIEIMEELLNLFLTMVPRGTQWQPLLKNAKSKLEQYAENEKAYLAAMGARLYEEEHLAMYFLYRYFMKSNMDEDVLGKIHIAVACGMLLRVLSVTQYAEEGSFSVQARINLVKLFSAEVEYAPCNMEALAEASLRSELFLPDTLLAMLMKG